MVHANLRGLVQGVKFGLAHVSRHGNLVREGGGEGLSGFRLGQPHVTQNQGVVREAAQVHAQKFSDVDV